MNKILCVAVLFALASCGKGEDKPASAEKFTITVMNDGNGDAEANKTSAEAGETVGLTASADGGFAFEKWVVVSGGVTLSSVGAQTTFRMPANNVSLRAEFVEEGEVDVLDEISDAQFKAYCVARLGEWDTDSDGKLSIEEAAVVETIGLSDDYTGVESLEGLEYFTGLQTLGVGGLSELDELDVSGFTKLTTLNAFGCALRKLDVSGCTALTQIQASSNELTALDVSSCTELIQLVVYDNQLAEINIDNNRKLTLLQVGTNPGNGTTFPINAWFDENSLPTTNFPDPKNGENWATGGNWDWNGTTITVDYI